MSRSLKINHVALVVQELESALKFWCDDLGLKLESQRDVPAEESQVAYLPIGNSHIELVEPLNDDSGVARFLSKRGPGMHHLCLEVEDLDAMAERLRTRGVRLINESPRLGADGTRYLFVHPQSTGGVLLELYQLPGSAPSPPP